MQQAKTLDPPGPSPTEFFQEHQNLTTLLFYNNSSHLSSTIIPLYMEMKDLGTQHSLLK